MDLAVSSAEVHGAQVANAAPAESRTIDVKVLLRLMPVLYGETI
jgi:hypothetical protein